MDRTQRIRIGFNRVPSTHDAPASLDFSRSAADVEKSTPNVAAGAHQQIATAKHDQVIRVDCGIRLSAQATRRWNGHRKIVDITSCGNGYISST